MDTGTLLGIIGLIATIVFGLLSIDSIRKKRNPIKLTLVKQSAIGLFKNISNNFNEIKIKYKDSPIQKNLIYVKGTIINNGDVDLKLNNTPHKVALNLDPQLKWIDAKITKNSHDLKCGTKISPNQTELFFNFGLVKKNEFFQFEALIEADDISLTEKHIFNKMTTQHRIADTQKIEKKDFPEKFQKKEAKKFYILYIFMFLILSSFLTIQAFSKDERIRYLNNDKEYFNATANSDGLITLTNVETDSTHSFTLKNFQNTNEFKPCITDLTIWERIFPLQFLMLLIFLGILLLALIDYLSIRKFNKITEILSDN